MRKNWLIILIMFAAISMTACGSSKSAPYEITDFAMGTVITQRIYNKNGEEIGKQVMDRIKKIESDMTITKAGGEINKLNNASGTDFVKLNEDAIFVLEKAKEFSEIGQGAFDVTVGPLVKEWGIFMDNPSVPAKERINSLLSLVDYRSITIDKNRSMAKLEKSGQIVDLGGIAKGFAADEAMEIYWEQSVESAFISLGGNVVTLGGKPDGSPWKVGIRNPRGPEGSYIGIVGVKDKAVVSSGDYERYFEKDGVRYHHILDPKTGYPANSGLIGTTIISDFSIDADALSTATFVLGLEKGMDLIEKLDGVEAVFVTSDKKVYITEGLKDIFEFEDESNEYEYVEKR
ncbi:FAD:protein FMN transferase [Acetivibrio cellulolyticus]|uniref:FAD:protein FMN transferase n=1 Tax=Acetivibrio cellulolyticus TaxID=35830 RepID=UPI0001E2DE38|nr:FAD:protein FMN transferase [Acetivibrio cellulolyticus]